MQIKQDYRNTLRSAVHQHSIHYFEATISFCCVRQKKKKKKLNGNFSAVLQMLFEGGGRMGRRQVNWNDGNILNWCWSERELQEGRKVFPVYFCFVRGGLRDGERKTVIKLFEAFAPSLHWTAEASQQIKSFKFRSSSEGERVAGNFFFCPTHKLFTLRLGFLFPTKCTKARR